MSTRNAPCSVSSVERSRHAVESRSLGQNHATAATRRIGRSGAPASGYGHPVHAPDVGGAISSRLPRLAGDSILTHAPSGAPPLTVETEVGLERGVDGSVGRVVPREERAGHVSRPWPGPCGPLRDLDTPPRSSSATRSADVWFRWSSGARFSAGRVVPREERAGHVSRPPAGPQEPSPDLDTPPRSSSATRSAEAV